MTQTLIEKLEALPLWHDRMWVKADDLRAIIEQHKRESGVSLQLQIAPTVLLSKDFFGLSRDDGVKIQSWLNSAYEQIADQSAHHTELIGELVEALEKVKPAVVCASDYYYDQPIMTLASKYNEMLSDIDALIAKAREAVKHE